MPSLPIHPHKLQRFPISGFLAIEIFTPLQNFHFPRLRWWRNVFSRPAVSCIKFHQQRKAFRENRERKLSDKENWEKISSGKAAEIFCRHRWSCRKNHFKSEFRARRSDRLSMCNIEQNKRILENSIAPLFALSSHGLRQPRGESELNSILFRSNKSTAVKG